MSLERYVYYAQRFSWTNDGFRVRIEEKNMKVVKEGDVVGEVKAFRAEVRGYLSLG